MAKSRAHSNRQRGHAKARKGSTKGTVGRGGISRQINARGK